MSDKNAASLQSLLRYSLPLGASIVAGDPDTEVNWSVTIRAQPPVFPDLYGGELALVSMDVLRSFDSRLTLSSVLRQLAGFGVNAVLSTGSVGQDAVEAANETGVALLSVPEDSSLTTVERAVNALILNHSARLTERAIEIQRQLTRLAAENRDLNSLLQVMSRSTGKPISIHDEAGTLIAQIRPYLGRRGMNGRAGGAAARHEEFQQWLVHEAPSMLGMISASPLGHTTALQVEKRVAGYLSVIDSANSLTEFDRLVLTYGADVCAIEMAKNRAIATAVEQTRGDWIQMWLSGTPADDDLLRTRAQRSGFQPGAQFLVAVYRALAGSGQSAPLESMLSLVRDDMSRRAVSGAVGQYVDAIVALYPFDEEDTAALTRARASIEAIRAQLAVRMSGGGASAGISRPACGLSKLRDAYREAKDAVGIAQELSDHDSTTYYGDLKLYQLLLALKERNLDNLQRFSQDALGPLIEHDSRKQSDLVRTLSGFFAANGNLAKAAQELDVHRNTLVYRLERIAELTKLDLDDSDNRLILHLALKTQRVLATIPGEAAIL
ncbi:MAG: helix-turn-helix domain-containing protein [Chloroflexota bacterium]|nr:helix-turn-helix domain-containing protein [Chloroflexota bacterium]